MNLSVLMAEFIFAGVSILAFQELPNIPTYALTLETFQHGAKTLVTYGGQ